MTWHQWQVEYPMDRKTGFSSALAFSKASFPHGYQSTGLSLCWRRYGLFSFASRFAIASRISRRDENPLGQYEVVGGRW
jgi:hypothetical protein